MKQKIKLGEFAPDLDPYTPGIILTISNIIPTLHGYRAANSSVSVSLDFVAHTPITATVLLQLDLTSRFFVGTANNIYEKSGSSWTDRSGSIYNASVDFRWMFAQFGNTSLAVNKSDALQYSNSGAFAAVAGAPKAGAMCTSPGFVMLGNYNDGTDTPDGWFCSAYNDYSDWTPSVATQCAKGRLIDTPGPIRAMVGFGDNVVAYKDRSMYVGTYSQGSAAVWNWNLIPGQIGCRSQEAIVDIGTAHYFMGFEDFYMFDGTYPVSIGAPIREWFFNRTLDPSYAGDVRTIHDRANSLIYWFYPYGFVGGKRYFSSVVYNYKSNKWGAYTVGNIICPVLYLSSGYTWDTMPLTTWDSWPTAAWDSPYWTAQSEVPAYFDGNNDLRTLTGTPGSSVLTTGYYGDEEYYTLVSGVKLKYAEFSSTDTFMTHRFTNTDVNNFTVGSPASTYESNGKFDTLISAKWHKFDFSFQGSVEVTGMSIDINQDGEI